MSLPGQMFNIREATRGILFKKVDGKTKTNPKLREAKVTHNMTLKLDENKKKKIHTYKRAFPSKSSSKKKKQ